MKRIAGLLAVLCMIVLMGSLPVVSQTGQAPAPPKFQSEEYMLFGNVNVGGGESEIAVNPKDPTNILVGILAGKHRLADGKLPDGQPSTRSQRLGEADWCYSVLAMTHDRGQTWTFSEDQLRKKFDLNNCFDPIVEAAPDGTLYWGCLPEVSRDGSDYRKGSVANGGPIAMRGGSYIMSSTDKGKTWTEPSMIMGSDQAARWPNGGKNMVWELSSPWDRAVVDIDHGTGTLYATGHGRRANPAHQEDSVTASHDKGKTWGPVYTWDSEGAEYPQSGSGDIGAGNGLLAISYIASKVPDASVTCPCIVFETSKDDGKTFERHVVPTVAPPRQASLAVDQGKPGRYAIMTTGPDDSQQLVYLTEDYGKTWSKPIVAAQAPSGAQMGTAGSSRVLSAIKYSPKGELGILWRAVYPDNSSDIWSSVSSDGGRQFKTVRVSHATSPLRSTDRGHFLVGDDYWDLDFDSELVHFVWTDSRPGFLATWYGRVPLSAYGPARNAK